MNKNMCSIGKFIGDQCDKITHTRGRIGREQKENLSEDEIELLSRRCGLLNDTLNDVCFHHLEVFLLRYTRNQKKCCDPYQTHARVVKSAPHEIDISLCEMAFEKLGIRLIPGKKLCKRCNSKMQKSLEEMDMEVDEETSQDEAFDDDADAGAANTDAADADFIPDIALPDTPRQELNQSLADLGVSPLRLHGVHVQERVAHGKRKLESSANKKVFSMQNV